ncbi:accessory factor associated with RNA polymerase II [Podochytrium sp. JEL0797]|nr:accessory factor associated with RNA polymerase II [Podochytrium sp. JEL0797]
MTPLPVTLLRNDAHPALFDASGAPTTVLSETHFVEFSAAPGRLAADTPAGYKTYSLLALLYFLSEKQREHAQYIQGSLQYWASREVPSVSFMDRRDLLDYLTGVSETSAFVRAAPDSSAQAKKRPAEADPAQPKKQKTDPVLHENDAANEQLAAEIKADFDHVKRILANERTIVNLNNFMSAKATKPFTYAIKYAQEILRPQQIPSSKPVDPKARSSHHAKPSSSAPHKDARSSSNSKTPIIIVPPSVTSVITIFNAKNLLSDLKFLSTEDGMKLTPGDKPGMIILDRKQAPQGLPKQYHVYDSVDRLKTDDWDRIVAVFTTGQAWQFKGWKWTDPVSIFSRAKGFNLKYVDEPLNDNVKSWNVMQLNIHRTKRHLDTQTVNDFWMTVEGWIKEKRGAQFLR